jgi:hypothetical protein
MLFVEFFADKIPLLDSAWDTVHTFIRIPAGAGAGGNGVWRPGPRMADGDGGARR